MNNNMEFLYVVSRFGKLGFIDYKGNPVTGYDFTGLIGGFGNPNGLLIVTQGEKRGLINSKGLIAPCVYDAIDSLVRDGYVTVTKDNKKGLIGIDGSIRVPCDYEDIGYGDYTDFIRVKRDGKWGFVDKSGEEVIPCIYDEIISFAKGIDVTFAKADNKYAIINKN